MLLTLAISALACESDTYDVVAISPEDGSMQVPRDARIVFQVRGEGALEPSTMHLFGPDGVVPGTWHGVSTHLGHGSLWTFVPASPLAANGHFVMDIEAENQPDAAYQMPAWGAGFTTGELYSAPLDGVPRLTLFDVGQAMEGLGSRCEPDGFRRTSYHFEPVETERPAESWFRLYLVSDGEDVLLDARRLDGRSWEDTAEVLVPETDASFCLVGAQRSPNGDEVRSDLTCFEAATLPEDQTVAYYGGAGCSATGSKSIGLFASLLALLGIRRR